MEEGQREVVDLTAYRSRRDEKERLQLKADPGDAEEVLSEVAHYILMVVRAITRNRH
jgi:hypothetical protein